MLNAEPIFNNSPECYTFFYFTISNPDTAEFIGDLYQVIFLFFYLYDLLFINLFIIKEWNGLGNVAKYL